MAFSRQNILIGILAIAILGGGYLYFFGGKGQALPLSTTAAPSPDEQKFLDLANELSSISFDTSIFSDPRLGSLIDLATPIAPEPVGRTDPFAAFGR